MKELIKQIYNISLDFYREEYPDQSKDVIESLAKLATIDLAKERLEKMGADEIETAKIMSDIVKLKC